jgi:alpha-L-fucosidase 2
LCPSLCALRPGGGKTEWVHIASDAGETCVVATDLARPIEAVGNRAFTITEQGGNKIVIDLKKGESVLLKTKGTTPDLHINPVKDDGCTNYFPERKKLKSGKQDNRDH